MLEKKTSGSLNGGSAGFFHIGEMQIYDVQKYYIIKDAEAEAQALMKAMLPLPSEATDKDYEELQKAYNDFMYKVFGIIPSGIYDISGANKTTDNVIYDLSGRRVATPVKGVYIVDGKKQIFK